MKNLLLLFIMISFVCTSCTTKTSSQEKRNISIKSVTATYKNPVYSENSPDPSVVRGDNGMFYVFSGSMVLESPDLVNWERRNRWAFDITPKWTKGDIWATDVTKCGNHYVMYYALSEWGEHWKNGVGVAIADQPEGPYTDKGKLFTSEEIKVGNSIDPHYFEEDGVKYLSWGSFYGLYAVELSNNGLSVKAGCKSVKLAGDAYEGIMIHKHNAHYYLFASTGSCCDELNSSYTTVVGRSDSYWGPYVNRKGERMLDNKHEVLISNNDYFVGTGHNSEIVNDDSGNEWIMYHAYNVARPEDGRVLLLDRIYWKDGWPMVQGNHPSHNPQKAPTIK